MRIRRNVQRPVTILALVVMLILGVVSISAMTQNTFAEEGAGQTTRSGQGWREADRKAIRATF